MRRILLATALVLGIGVSAATAQPAPPAERVYTRPSGFWTSPHPSRQAYRWRLLGIGVLLLGVTGVVMWRLVKRADLDRARRGSSRH
ncbi:MAG: hypothetical protein AB7O24_26990 [Kofleriaceae bacterium]